MIALRTKNWVFCRYEKSRYAMLDTLLEAEVNGEQIDAVGIREEVDTFMFEGYDTTSAGILFSLFMIATHQHEQQGIFDEICSVMGINVHLYNPYFKYNEELIFLQLKKKVTAANWEFMIIAI